MSSTSPPANLAQRTAAEAAVDPVRVVDASRAEYNPRGASIPRNVTVRNFDPTSFSGNATTNNYRVGLGEDRHRTAPGGPLRLGGVDVPHDCHLEGQSDADVLLHAITDALLGAAALPDIGQMFPNDDPRNADRDSAEMLALAADKVAQAGYRIVNLDCVVAAERPKIAPHKMSMQARIAEILGLNVRDVGLKAKTGEKIGPIGRGEAVESRCIALLERLPDATNDS